MSSIATPKFGRLRLLPRESLVKTGDVDHADWNFRPLLGTIQRMRFKLMRELLVGRRYPRLLEIGYGSGIFMPELSKHCDELYGLDPHAHQQEVRQSLSAHGITAHLDSGSATDIPHADGFFDAVVAVSAFEFIEPIEQACREIRRVLAPGGVLALVTPGQSLLVDLGLKLLTGKSAKEDFGDRREAIITSLLKYFEVEQRADSPWLVQHAVRLYTGLRLCPCGERAELA